MIHGMTGFSSRAFSYKGSRWIITIRSVNHKFFDCVINLPEELSMLDEHIKKELHKQLHRGRVVFQLISFDPPARALALNKKLLSEYLSCMKNIHHTLGIAMDITIGDIMRLPEVVSLRAAHSTLHKDFVMALNRATQDAIKKLVVLRKKEGKAIYDDSCKRIQAIQKTLSFIQKRVRAVIAEKKKELVNDELKDFLKSCNVEEEAARLQFHITTFRTTLKQTGSLGKVLDFIVQEMQREINTLGAKFRDARVSYLSIIVKDEIEKIREQLQNVE